MSGPESAADHTLPENAPQHVLDKLKAALGRHYDNP